MPNFGGSSGSDMAEAAEKAAQSQVEAAQIGASANIDIANAALGFMTQMANTARQDVAPWRMVGINALEEMSMLMGLGKIPKDTTRISAPSVPQSTAIQQLTGKLPVSGGFNSAEAIAAGKSGTGSTSGAINNYVPNQAYYASNLASQGASGGSSESINSYRTSLRTPTTTTSSALNTQPSAYVPGANGQMVPVYAPASVTPNANAYTGNRASTLASRRGQTTTGPTKSNAELQQEAMSRFYTSPGYDFRKKEGMKAIEEAASSKGSLFSGATQKALESFAEGNAANEFANYYNRLGGLSGTGATAAGQSANAASNLGSAAGTLLGALGAGLNQNSLAQGNARASGYINAANAQAADSGMGIGDILGGVLSLASLASGIGGLGGLGGLSSIFGAGAGSISPLAASSFMKTWT